MQDGAEKCEGGIFSYLWCFQEDKHEENSNEGSSYKDEDEDDETDSLPPVPPVCNVFDLLKQFLYDYQKHTTRSVRITVTVSVLYMKAFDIPCHVRATP